MVKKFAPNYITVTGGEIKDTGMDDTALAVAG